MQALKDVSSVDAVDATLKSLKDVPAGSRQHSCHILLQGWKVDLAGRR